MRAQLLSVLIFSLISIGASAQVDTLNRLDADNQKTGWWLIYLDDQLAETEDTNKAVYSKFTYFDGRFDYFNMGKIGTKKSPVIAPKDEVRKGITPLHGDYKASFKNGQTRFVLSTKNGKFVEYKEFYANGVLKTRFDYTTSCGETPLAYCIYEYSKDGTLKSKSTIQVP